MLKLDTLCAGYGPLPILHDLCLEVGCDEVVGIVGANGAGKTTMVRALAGLHPLLSGGISLDGRALAAEPAHRRAAAGLAFVLDNRALFGDLSVAQNLKLASLEGARSGRTEGPLTEAEIAAHFPLLEEHAHRPVQFLSGGQQQMVAIARALLLRPRLLVMDEPSAGLAPLIVRQILDLLKRLKGCGMGVLIVEQNVSLVADVADRGYAMALGRIVHEVARGGWKDALADDALIKAYFGGPDRKTTV